MLPPSFSSFSFSTSSSTLCCPLRILAVSTPRWEESKCHGCDGKRGDVTCRERSAGTVTVTPSLCFIKYQPIRITGWSFTLSAGCGSGNTRLKVQHTLVEVMGATVAQQVEQVVQRPNGWRFKSSSLLVRRVIEQDPKLLPMSPIGE